MRLVVTSVKSLHRSQVTSNSMKAGFRVPYSIVFHRISSGFWVYDILGLIPIYENQPKQGILIHPNSSQFIAVQRN